MAKEAEPEIKEAVGWIHLSALLEWDKERIDYARSLGLTPHMIVCMGLSLIKNRRSYFG